MEPERLEQAAALANHCCQLRGQVRIFGLDPEPKEPALDDSETAEGAEQGDLLGAQRIFFGPQGEGCAVGLRLGFTKVVHEFGV